MARGASAEQVKRFLDSLDAAVATLRERWRECPYDHPCFEDLQDEFEVYQRWRMQLAELADTAGRISATWLRGRLSMGGAGRAARHTDPFCRSERLVGRRPPRGVEDHCLRNCAARRSMVRTISGMSHATLGHLSSGAG